MSRIRYSALFVAVYLALAEGAAAGTPPSPERTLLDRARISAANLSSGLEIPALIPLPSPKYSSTGQRQTTINAHFGFDDFYRNGAKVAQIWGPRDTGYRVISMKLYTVKQGDGSLQMMIGIVDITPNDPETPYAPKFIPVTQSETTEFQLKRGGRIYTFSTSMNQGQHNILLTRQYVRNGQAAALSTSVEELSRLLADQAAAGDMVTIGSRQFYTAPQGGVHGSILFFPKEAVDERADVLDARYLWPVAMGDVLRLDGDGLTVRMSGHPDIGTIDGVAYHLEYDGAGWTVVEGVGDQP